MLIKLLRPLALECIKTFALALALQRASAQRGLEEPVLRVRVWRDHLPKFAHVPRGVRRICRRALCEQRALDDIQPPIRPRLEVAAEIVAEEEVVHECPILFVREIRLDDLVKKRRVLFREEEVQLVAGEFGILRALLVVLELRPFEHPREFRERRIAVQRGEQRVDAAKRVVGLELAREDIRERERLARLHDGRLLFLREWLHRIEVPHEAQVGEFRRHLRHRDGAPHGIREILRVNLDVLAVAEELAVNAHSAVLVRDEVVNHRRGCGEEVNVRLRRRAAGAGELLLRLFGECAAQARFTFTARRARGLPGLLREILHVGRAAVPRIQQDARTREHVAGEKLQVTAIQDVAVFVADLAARGVEIRQARWSARRCAEAHETAEVAENSAARLEARHGEMHTRERRGVREFHGDRVGRRRDIRDVQRRFRLCLQIARVAEIPAMARLAAAHFDCNVPLLLAQPQRVVARRESLDDEETAFSFHLFAMVGDERACIHLEQRHLRAQRREAFCVYPKSGVYG